MIKTMLKQFHPAKLSYQKLSRGSIINFVKNNYPYLILTIVPLIFFYPVFFGYVLFPGEILNSEFYPWSDLKIGNNDLPYAVHRFFGSDPMIAHFPWKFIGIEMLKSGQWPLWNPYSFAGSPLLANGQSALFYPLNFFYFILNFNTAWNTLTVLQVILSGLFCFFLLKEYKLSKFSSLWGGMIYAWNGYLANYLQIQVIGQALIWLPLALLGIIKLKIKNHSLFYFLLLVFSLTSILLSGYLQVSLYSLLIIFLFVLICYRELFGKFILALTLSFGLSAPQLLPTLEFISKSERSAELFYDYFSFLAPPAQLIRLLMPRFFGHPNSENWWGGMLQRDNSYIGVIGITFAVVGIYYIFQNRKFIFWVLLLILFLIFSIESPFSRYFYNLPIPLLNSVTPSRGLGMLVFPLSVLSAFGVEQFIQKRGIQMKIIGIILFSFSIIALFFYVNALNNYSQSLNIVQIVKQSFLFFSFIVIFLVILFIVYSRKIVPSFIIFILFFGIQTGDLLKENKFFSRTFINKDYLYPPTQLTDFLSKSDERFLSLNLWLLIPNSFLPYRIYSITSYDAIHLKSSYRLMEAIFNNIPQEYPLDPRSIRYSNLKKQLASFLNVRYILSLSPLTNKDFSYLEKIGSVYIYENTERLPYGFFVSNYQVLNRDQQEELIFKQNIDLGQTVLLYKQPSEKISKDDAGVVKNLKRGQGYSEWLVVTKSPKILVIAETYDDGWEVYIDGKKDKIYQANLAFQAMVIPAGNHNVKLEYSPKSFYIGLFISGSTLLVIMIFAGIKAVFFNQNYTNKKNG